MALSLLNHPLHVSAFHGFLLKFCFPDIKLSPFRLLASTCSTARSPHLDPSVMKKILGYSIVIVLVLGIGLYLTMQFFLGGIVKSAVNKFGPGITQTKVELQAANISPLSGVGTLTGLSVGNPAGWSQTDAFRLGKVHVNLEPLSLMKDRIEINELIIEEPEFFYETKVVASNVGDLLKNVEKAIGSKEGEPKTSEGKPIKLVVKKLVLKNGRVIIGAGGQVVTVPLPPIDMADIGVKEGGVTPAQLGVAIMRHVTPTIVAASMQALTTGGGAAGAAAVEGAKQIGGAIKGLFGGEKKEKEKGK